MNHKDDNGVLEGKWPKSGIQDFYPGGRNPLEWTGSVEILKKYVETLKPVKYGQCWVFAGLIQTGRLLNSIK